MHDKIMNNKYLFFYYEKRIINYTFSYIFQIYWSYLKKEDRPRIPEIVRVHMTFAIMII